MSTSARSMTRPITPRELSTRDNDGYELVDGRLVEKKMGFEANVVLGTIIYLLKCHCAVTRAAWIVPEQGYTCFPSRPDRMRRPDVSCILAERTTPDLFGEGFSPIRPDLAVEVVSLHDGYREVEEKLADYRDAAIPLVWVVEPSSRRVRVIRGDGSTSELGMEQELTGEAILPGFRCRVADLFDGLPSR